MNAPNPFTRAGPPVLEGAMALGARFAWLAEQVGVSEMTVSRWYRGERGMSAGQALFLTSLLAMMIEAGGEGLDRPELSQTDKQALRVRLDAARAWYALQGLANQELPEGCEHEALALRDARLRALRPSLNPVNSGPPRRHAQPRMPRAKNRSARGKAGGTAPVRPRQA